MVSSCGMTNSLLSSDSASAYPFGVTATVTSAPDKEHLVEREMWSWGSHEGNTLVVLQ